MHHWSQSAESVHSHCPCPTELSTSHHAAVHTLPTTGTSTTPSIKMLGARNRPQVGMRSSTSLGGRHESRSRPFRRSSSITTAPNRSLPQLSWSSRGGATARIKSHQIWKRRGMASPTFPPRLQPSPDSESTSAVQSTDPYAGNQPALGHALITPQKPPSPTPARQRYDLLASPAPSHSSKSWLNPSRPLIRPDGPITGRLASESGVIPSVLPGPARPCRAERLGARGAEYLRFVNSSFFPASRGTACLAWLIAYPVIGWEGMRK